MQDEAKIRSLILSILYILFNLSLSLYALAVP